MLILLERVPCSTNGEFSVVNITYENYLGLFGGGDFALTGKVGVCLDGVLGSLCDVNWDENDTSVVCNDIGLGGKFILCQYHQRNLVNIYCLEVFFTCMARYSVSLCGYMFM